MLTLTKRPSGSTAATRTHSVGVTTVWTQAPPRCILTVRSFEPVTMRPSVAHTPTPYTDAASSVTTWSEKGRASSASRAAAANSLFVGAVNAMSWTTGSIVSTWLSSSSERSVIGFSESLDVGAPAEVDGSAVSSRSTALRSARVGVGCTEVQSEASSSSVFALSYERVVASYIRRLGLQSAD